MLNSGVYYKMVYYDFPTNGVMVGSMVPGIARDIKIRWVKPTHQGAPAPSEIVSLTPHLPVQQEIKPENKLLSILKKLLSDKDAEKIHGPAKPGEELKRALQQHGYDDPGKTGLGQLAENRMWRNQ